MEVYFDIRIIEFYPALTFCSIAALLCEIEIACCEVYRHSSSHSLMKIAKTKLIFFIDSQKCFFVETSGKFVTNGLRLIVNNSSLIELMA